MKIPVASLVALSILTELPVARGQAFGPQIMSGAPAVPLLENSDYPLNAYAAPAPLPPAQLEQLLGPIALYPDALIALMLPAATNASDLVLAARYLGRDGAPASEIEEQPWDDSVKALAHYPDVVRWMDENLAWTKQLGDAFVAQPADVMNAVQRLRATARAAGTLVDTPQQQIIAEREVIRIVPAQPDVIYVPYYDPDIVYVRQLYYPAYARPLFSFSIGYPVGFWLGYNVDWTYRRIWTVDRHERERYWLEQRDWRRVSPPPVSAPHDVVVRTWTPKPSRPKLTPPTERRSGNVISRPTTNRNLESQNKPADIPVNASAYSSRSPANAPSTPAARSADAAQRNDRARDSRRPVAPSSPALARPPTPAASAAPAPTSQTPPLPAPAATLRSQPRTERPPAARTDPPRPRDSEVVNRRAVPAAATREPAVVGPRSPATSAPQSPPPSAAAPATARSAQPPPDSDRAAAGSTTSGNTPPPKTSYSRGR